MSIFSKTIEIYKEYYICPNCLGRMFALLGTHTTNLERGNSLLLALTLKYHQKYLSSDNESQKEALNYLKTLAENARFIPSRKVLENEGIVYSNQNDEPQCYLCQGIFSKIDQYVKKA